MVTPAQAKYRKEYRDSSVVCLSTEIENGNVEYKYCLSGAVSNPNRRHQLVSCCSGTIVSAGRGCFVNVVASACLLAVASYAMHAVPLA